MPYGTIRHSAKASMWPLETWCTNPLPRLTDCRSLLWRPSSHRRILMAGTPVRDAPKACSEQTAGMTDSLEPDPPLSKKAMGSPLAQRVSDAERDETVTLLREHLVVGRLTLDEFSERISVALQARTRGDLHEALANLP